MLCVSLFFSCSSGDSTSQTEDLSSSSSNQQYCVSIKKKECKIATSQPCPSGSSLLPSCPFDNSSSSSADDDPPEEGEDSSSSNSTGNNPSSSSPQTNSSGSQQANSSGSQQNYSSNGGGGECIEAEGPVACYGKLQASGNKIVGSKTGSTAVQVRGVSLGWSNKGWESANFFNDATVNAMVDKWKAEIIRVPMGYAALGADEYSGSYLADKNGNMTRVKAAIDAAITKGVYVIIDWHTHTSNTTDASAYFEEMASEYGNYPNVIFEIFNEPLNVAWSSIRTYATTVIATIRKYSSNLILVGTPKWDQEVDSALDNPLTDNNVAYVVHFYADSHPLNGGTYSPNFASKINSVHTAGYPVFVSEYGTVSADGNGSHNASASNTWMTFLNNNSISYCAWHVNNKNEASAFFKTTFTPSASAAWTSTSNMTASGQYIYNNLVAWSSNAPWRSSSSSGGVGVASYCDYGYPHSAGGGCVLMKDANDCDLDWGVVVASCGRTDLSYCQYSTTKCYSTTSCIGGTKVSSCPSATICTDEDCNYDCREDYGPYGCR